ncbi:MAG TPA: hypothetical protein VEK06_01985 [Myxococcota bacterium]|nr:hypothetical protein [Myxococcota bacterium]
MNRLRNGSLRVHTRASQSATSSNPSFQKYIRNGLGTGLNLTNSATRQVLRPLPGSAAISASLSDAAAKLSGPSSLGGENAAFGSSGIDGDTGSLQDELLRNNNEMLETQMRVLQATTSINTRSNIVKAMYDTLKTIGSNIR